MSLSSWFETYNLACWKSYMSMHNFSGEKENDLLAKTITKEALTKIVNCKRCQLEHITNERVYKGVGSLGVTIVIANVDVFI